MSIFLKAILGFVLGCIGGSVGAFVVSAGLMQIFISAEECRFEGGCGLGAVMFGFFGFWIGGIVGAIWLAVRQAKRLEAARTTTTNS